MTAIIMRNSKGLKLIKKLVIHGAGETNCSLNVCSGSVVEFRPTTLYSSKSAIVNAANQGCIDGGGVDGAINVAGGKNLKADRLALPIIGEKGKKVRCPTGDAKIVGPGIYGNLAVPYVIHAVGPNYNFVSVEVGDQLLYSAYEASLFQAKLVGVQEIAFSLLSAGVYRGNRKIDDVLNIAVQATIDFQRKHGTPISVHLCAFTKEQERALLFLTEHLQEE